MSVYSPILSYFSTVLISGPCHAINLTEKGTGVYGSVFNGWIAQFVMSFRPFWLSFDANRSLLLVASVFL